MSPPVLLTWALLAVGVALWSLPTGHGWPGRPRPALALVAGGLVGLYCVLVACAAGS